MKPSRRLKISFFSHNALPILKHQFGDFGGAEWELVSLARELVLDPNYEICFSVLGERAERFEDHGLDCRVVKKMQSEDRFRGSFWSYVVSFFRSMYGINPDIYFTALASLQSVLIFFVARSRGAKYVFRIEHDWETDRIATKKNIFGDQSLPTRLFFWTLKHADQVVAQTASQQQALKNNLGIESVVIPNAHIIEEQAGDIRTQQNILWLGRLVPNKLPELFLKLATAIPQEKFVIVGNAANNGYYEKIEREAQHISNLEWVGGVSKDKVKSYYNEAKAFVLTSESEGFPNTLIESWLAGVPTLSLHLDPDGVVEAQKIGYVAHGSFDQLVADTIKLLTDEKLRSEMGKRAAEHARRTYDIKEIIKIYKDIFNS